MRRTALVFTLLWSCAPGPIEEGPDGDDAQAAALVRLEAETGSPWTLRNHADVHTPAFLEGRTRPIAAQPWEAAAAARSFFKAHGALFRLRDASKELHAGEVEVDELGMAHVRFRQEHEGVTVLGGELAAHFDAEGALVRVIGRYVPLSSLSAPVAVAMSANEASALAKATASVVHPGATAPEVRKPELVADASGDALRTAWRTEVLVEEPPVVSRLEVLIDATTGEAYRVGEMLDDLTGSGIGVFGERLPLEISERSGRFYLDDPGDGAFAGRTYAMTTRLPGRALASDDRDRWDEAAPAPGAAVSAHAYLSATQRYFARVHGRRGADGKAGIMRATVHFGAAFGNAFWNGRQLVFGDGDGRMFAPLAGALDVVAHEFSHAVIEHTSRLGHAGEAGALNEAIADLFGCFIERSLWGERGNWLIGERVYWPGRHRALRNLADPHQTRQPAHVSEQARTAEDRGGVHANAAIPGHAGFLLARGGTNTVSGLSVSGIGDGPAQKIWYRALAHYLYGSASFRDMADATLAAARDLYGSGAKTSAVDQAWTAVGVLPPR